MPTAIGRVDGSADELTTDARADIYGASGSGAKISNIHHSTSIFAGRTAVPAKPNSTGALQPRLASSRSAGRLPRNRSTQANTGTCRISPGQINASKIPFARLVAHHRCPPLSLKDSRTYRICILECRNHRLRSFQCNDRKTACRSRVEKFCAVLRADYDRRGFHGLARRHARLLSENSAPRLRQWSISTTRTLCSLSDHQSRRTRHRYYSVMLRAGFGGSPSLKLKASKARFLIVCPLRLHGSFGLPFPAASACDSEYFSERLRRVTKKPGLEVVKGNFTQAPLGFRVCEFKTVTRPSI